MPFCEKCGNEVNEDDEFCPQCNAVLKPAHSRRDYRRSEKNEKGEKNEDDPNNRMYGGLVLVWLGISFVLRETGFVTHGNWWAVFLMGLGVLMLVRGYLKYNEFGRLGPAQGYLIGGVVLVFIGASEFLSIGEWWPYMIIIVGGLVVLRALTERKNNPLP